MLTFSLAVIAEAHQEEDGDGDPEDRVAQLVAEFEAGDPEEHGAVSAQAARRSVDRVEK